MTEDKVIVQFTPFIVRAIYDWCAVNGITPKIRVMINDNLSGIPDAFRIADIIEFDISEKYTEDLVISNEFVSFTTGFDNGQANVKIGFENICGVFGEDTNINFVFVETPKAQKTKTSNKPILKRIK